MRQVPSYADTRELAWCVHCGSSEIETRDHVPSRVLLDEPYPENLPVVASCSACNQGLSQDEEYVACLIECALCGGAKPGDVRRTKIARILQDRPLLSARIANAKSSHEGATVFAIEDDRVRRVMIKLARGHALYELQTSHRTPPASFAVVPLPSLSQERRGAFEASPETNIWPEVGSRAMQRLVEDEDAPWVTVQPGRYRYLAATTEAETVIRMVFSEYLACEVVWGEYE